MEGCDGKIMQLPSQPVSRRRHRQPRRNDVSPVSAAAAPVARDASSWRRSEMRAHCSVPLVTGSVHFQSPSLTALSSVSDY